MTLAFAGQEGGVGVNSRIVLLKKPINSPKIISIQF
jgi:hypothetical protein